MIVRALMLVAVDVDVARAQTTTQFVRRTVAQLLEGIMFEMFDDPCFLRAPYVQKGGAESHRPWSITASVIAYRGFVKYESC